LNFSRFATCNALLTEPGHRWSDRDHAGIAFRPVAVALRWREVASTTQPVGRTLVLTVALLASLVPHSAFVQDATPVAVAVAGMPLEVKVGQMILAGVEDQIV